MPARLLAVLVLLPGLGGCTLLYRGDFEVGTRPDAGTDAGVEDAGQLDAPEPYDAGADAGPEACGDAGGVGPAPVWRQTLHSTGGVTVLTVGTSGAALADPVVVGGTFGGELTATPALAPSATLTARGASEGFLLRLDQAGMPQASVAIGSAAGSALGDLTEAVVRADVDIEGNTYAGVRFTSELDVGGTVFSAGDMSGVNFAIVKLDATLTPLWRTTIVGPFVEHLVDLDDRTAESGGGTTLAFAGYTNSAYVQIENAGTSTMVPASWYGRDWIVAQLDRSTGALQWATSIGEPMAQDEVGGIAAGGPSIAVAGCLGAATDVGPSVATGMPVMAGPGPVIVQWENSGMHRVRWARTFTAGTGACFDDIVYDPTDGPGGMWGYWVVGRFPSTFDDGAGAVLTSRGGLDGVVMRVGSDGTVRRTIQVGAEADEAAYHASASLLSTDRRTLAVAAYLHPSMAGATASWGGSPMTLSTDAANLVDGAVVRFDIAGDHQWTLPLVGNDVESFADVTVLFQGDVVAAGNVRAGASTVAGCGVTPNSAFVARLPR